MHVYERDLERRLRHCNVSITDADHVTAGVTCRVAALVDAARGRSPLADAHVNLVRVLVENRHRQVGRSSMSSVHQERGAFVDHHTVLFNAPTLHLHLHSRTCIHATSYSAEIVQEGLAVVSIARDVVV